MNTRTFAGGVFACAIASLLSACSGGPSESELVQACMKGSHPQLVSEGMCKCFARATLESMPPEMQRAMMLEMRGNKQEAAAIVEKLSFEQRAEIAMKQLETLGECAAAG